MIQKFGNPKPFEIIAVDQKFIIMLIKHLYIKNLVMDQKIILSLYDHF